MFYILHVLVQMFMSVCFTYGLALIVSGILERKRKKDDAEMFKFLDGK